MYYAFRLITSCLLQEVVQCLPVYVKKKKLHAHGVSHENQWDGKVIIFLVAVWCVFELVFLFFKQVARWIKNVPDVRVVSAFSVSRPQTETSLRVYSTGTDNFEDERKKKDTPLTAGAWKKGPPAFALRSCMPPTLFIISLVPYVEETFER